MTPENQIILQTLGDFWLCFSACFIVASFLQIYNNFKGLNND